MQPPHRATRKGRLLFGIASILSGSVLGCRAVPQIEPAPCIGDRLAVAVKNATPNTIDVYLHIAQNQNGSILGTVPVGGTELRLPPVDRMTPIRFTARRPNGSTIAPAFGNRVEYSRIKYTVICAGGAAG